MAYNRGAIALAAKTAHNANHQYNMFRGIDRNTKPWDELTEEEKHRLIIVATRVFDNPEMSPEDCHRNWVEDMAKAGWRYGEQYSENAKTHPCMTDNYSEVPDEDKIKDTMYLSIVKSFCVLGNNLNEVNDEPQSKEPTPEEDDEDVYQDDDAGVDDGDDSDGESEDDDESK